MKDSSKHLIVATLLFLLFGTGAHGAAYDSGDVLSNGGFETGDLTESANNAMGDLPWLTSNTQNEIAVTAEQVHDGKYALAWKPIGWNVKDDGTLEDAGAYILNKCAEHVAAGAGEIHVTGFANTAALAADFRLQVGREVFVLNLKHQFLANLSVSLMTGNRYGLGITGAHPDDRFLESRDNFPLTDLELKGFPALG